ncbi:hypothetical protein BGZ83_003179, partial [Gryganskiella cystojenkinii]
MDAGIGSGIGGGVSSGATDMILPLVVSNHSGPNLGGIGSDGGGSGGGNDGTTTGRSIPNHVHTSQPTEIFMDYYCYGPHNRYPDGDDRRGRQQQKQQQQQKNVSHKHRHMSATTYKRVKFVLAWLLAIAVIAALVVTFIITRSIPFGTNCGNTHRALLGITVVIVLGGVAMPIYYKYLQRDLIRKDLEKLEKGELYVFDDPDLGLAKPRSVLASDRFSVVLLLTSFFLVAFVALGWYYLWSSENRCQDPKLWVVKGWFIALLIPTILVIFFMLVAMTKAMSEKKVLRKLAQKKTRAGKCEQSQGKNTDTVISTQPATVPEPTPKSPPPS